MVTKKTKTVSLTALAMKHCKKNKWTIAKTEHWNAFAKIRQDLFKMFDLLGIIEGKIVGIQVTSSSNLSARSKKMKANPILKEWLDAGGLAQVWTYKVSQEGKRKKYNLKITKIDLN